MGNDEGLDCWPRIGGGAGRIGVGRGGGKEAIWFAEERGRVERFPRLKLGRRQLRFVRSVYAQQINFLGGPRSLRTPVNELVSSRPP